MKKSYITLSLLLVLLAVTGCQKFLVVTASMEGGSLMFHFDSVYAVNLHDLEMARIDCMSDCVMWSTVNQIDNNGELTKAAIESRKFKYGQKLDGMDTGVPPKPLVPGTYIIGGTTSTKESAKSLFEYEFTLESNASGALVVVEKTK